MFISICVLSLFLSSYSLQYWNVLSLSIFEWTKYCINVNKIYIAWLCLLVSIKTCTKCAWRNKSQVYVTTPQSEHDTMKFDDHWAIAVKLEWNILISLSLPMIIWLYMYIISFSPIAQVYVAAYYEG